MLVLMVQRARPQVTGGQTLAGRALYEHTEDHAVQSPATEHVIDVTIN